MTQRLRPYAVSLEEANNYISLFHRHHKPVTGHRFTIGVTQTVWITGVAICGRPVSRRTDQLKVIEVLRCCTDGTPNACSWLYARCAEIAQILGAVKIQTFIRADEPGTSLIAAGWQSDGVLTRAGSWNSESRPRQDKTEIVQRKKYWKVLNVQPG